MTDQSGWTPYPEVNAVLAVLLDETRGVLGPHFVGMYLYGSLAGGDFDPASSDIDFLVVTDDEVSQEMLPALEAMHTRIAASGLPYRCLLEGSYIPRAALRRYDPENARHPSIGTDWPFKVGLHDLSWMINRYTIREQGVTLDGPPPGTLIDHISTETLQVAVRDHLVHRWAEELQHPDWLHQRYYQAFAILTMCRALYLLETGRFATKPVAAAWAQEHMEARWAALVARALTWRNDHAPDDMTEALAFIRYTVERARNWAAASGMDDT